MAIKSKEQSLPGIYAHKDAIHMHGDVSLWNATEEMYALYAR